MSVRVLVAVDFCHSKTVFSLRGVLRGFFLVCCVVIGMSRWHICAYSADRSMIIQKAMTAVQTMYAWEFDRAESMLQSLATTYPQDPTGDFFLSSLYMWKYLAGNNQDDLKKFLMKNEQAIRLGEEALARNPNDSYVRTIIGSSFGYRSLANMRAENFIKASWDARSCYDYLNEVLKRNPNEYEAYVGMGIFQFVLGSVPTSVQWAVNLTGLRGDRDVGMKLLTIAAEKSQYFKQDAVILLGLLAVYYKNDYTTGIRYLKGLLDTYPRNAGILYALGNIESQLKKMPLAIGYFQRILADESNKGFTVFTAFAQFRIGEAYFRLNDFENAKRYMQRFVKSVNDKAFRSVAFVRLGVCYEVEGDRANALKAYTFAMNDKSITTEDRWARRKAKEYVSAPMSERMKQLIRGENAVESRNCSAGEQMLRPIADDASASIEERALAWYFIGESYRLREQYALARSAYQRIAQIQPTTEKWLLPWSFYRLSECAYAEKNIESARGYLDKAKVYSRFDFEEWLIFALERDVMKLK